MVINQDRATAAKSADRPSLDPGLDVHTFQRVIAAETAATELAIQKALVTNGRHPMRFGELVRPERFGHKSVIGEGDLRRKSGHVVVSSYENDIAANDRRTAD